MITFLPYADFEKTAAVLDMQRLQKQRVENLQILCSIFGVRLITRGKQGRQWYDLDSTDWDFEDVSQNANYLRIANHPASLMWARHPVKLFEYQTVICNEWTRRGGKNDTCLPKSQLVMDVFRPGRNRGISPFWLGDKELHLTHQSNLLRKNYMHYLKYFKGVHPGMPYKWPVTKEDLREARRWRRYVSES